MQSALRSFANFMSQCAHDAGAVWPFFILPNYEMHASALRMQTGLEVLNVLQFVKDKDANETIQFVNSTYKQWINESHMFLFGNLDRLSPTKYKDYFGILTAEGMVPDTEKRDMHFPMFLFSPRTSDYIFTLHYPLNLTEVPILRFCISF
jgi:hypothetical protein